MKERIAELLADPDSDLVWTNNTPAYGAGADPQKAVRVVWLTPPANMESEFSSVTLHRKLNTVCTNKFLLYPNCLCFQIIIWDLTGDMFAIFTGFVQAMGRVGRGGELATATVYYNNSDLASPHIDPVMKKFLRSQQCRRDMVVRYFGFTLRDPNPRCCDHCVFCYEDIVASISSLFIHESEEDKMKRESLHNSLKLYFAYERKARAGYCTGLSDSVLEAVVSRPCQFTHTITVLQSFPGMKDHYASNIAKIVKATLSL